MGLEVHSYNLFYADVHNFRYHFIEFTIFLSKTVPSCQQANPNPNLTLTLTLTLSFFQRPFLPVSRQWNFVQGGVNLDWAYVIFDWDNIFATYMTSLDAKEIAYSNFIQVIRSRTSDNPYPSSHVPPYIPA